MKTSYWIFGALPALLFIAYHYVSDDYEKEIIKYNKQSEYYQLKLDYHTIRNMKVIFECGAELEKLCKR